VDNDGDGCGSGNKFGDGEVRQCSSKIDDWQWSGVAMTVPGTSLLSSSFFFSFW